MDATELLRQDHDTVRQLFERFRSARDDGDVDRMRELQRQIFEELETHTRIEEQILYPDARDADDELRPEVAESVQEHHVVKVLMREIESISDPEVYVAKMNVLMENVEHHAGEEEDELFPELRERWSAEELEEVGQRLAAAKG